MIATIMNAPMYCADMEHETIVDTYDLPSSQLSDYDGIIVSMGADQILLSRMKKELSQWVRAGGKILINGLPMRSFVDDMPTHRKMQFHGFEDVWLHHVEDHPIWEGIDMRDVLLCTGVAGSHTFEEMLEIGVAGFYARSYLAELPKGAQVITGIGPCRLPVDISYRLGAGEVIVHCGNDLGSFCFAGTTTAHLRKHIHDYLNAHTPLIGAYAL